MNKFITIIGIQLIILASGHYLFPNNFKMTPTRIFYITLASVIFSVSCLQYSFRNKGNKYGYYSIGGKRGFL